MKMQGVDDNTLRLPWGSGNKTTRMHNSHSSTIMYTISIMMIIVVIKHQHHLHHHGHRITAIVHHNYHHHHHRNHEHVAVIQPLPILCRPFVILVAVSKPLINDGLVGVAVLLPPCAISVSRCFMFFCCHSPDNFGLPPIQHGHLHVPSAMESRPAKRRRLFVCSGIPATARFAT